MGKMTINQAMAEIPTRDDFERKVIDFYYLLNACDMRYYRTFGFEMKRVLEISRSMSFKRIIRLYAKTGGDESRYCDKILKCRARVKKNG